MAKKKKNTEFQPWKVGRKTWAIKPTTQVVPNKKKADSKKACRGKVER